MKRTLSAVFCAALLTSSTCGLAHAQSMATPNLRSFTPSIAPDGGLMIEPTTTPSTFAWNGGALSSWAWNPLTLRNGNNAVVGRVIEHQLAADWFANIGIGKGTAVGLLVPSVVAQTGQHNTYTDTALGGAPLISGGMGDMSVIGQLTLLSHNEVGGFGLAGIGKLTLPTGDKRALFAEGALGGEFRLVGEYAIAGTALRATTGVRFRGEKRSFSGSTWGNEIPWAVGATLRPQVLGIDPEGHWSWSLEAFGSLPAGPSSPFTNATVSPTQVSASARYGIGDISLISALQAPIDRAAGVPLMRVVVGIGWAPRMQDEDHDGVDDAHDECPELAEDHDGFEDQDGCPDFDNDSDGVPDAEDQCPKQQEDLDGYEDEDGCPEPGGPGQP